MRTLDPLSSDLEGKDTRTRIPSLFATRKYAGLRVLINSSSGVGSTLGLLSISIRKKLSFRDALPYLVYHLMMMDKEILLSSFFSRHDRKNSCNEWEQTDRQKQITVKQENFANLGFR